MHDDNPYEHLDLDPRADLETLTERLRDLAEDLPPEERAPVQAIWQSLTMRRRERIQHALLARPRGREAPPISVLVRALPQKLAPAMEPPTTDALRAGLEVRDLLLTPSMLAEGSAPPLPPLPPPPSLDDDPFF